MVLQWHSKATIETDVPTLRVEIEDTSPPQDDIATLLQQGADIIAKHIGGAAQRGSNCIYVHCSEGVGRSPSVVIAYLARSHPLRKALALVQSARSGACPGAGFLKPIAEREKEAAAKDSEGSVLEGLVKEVRLDGSAGSSAGSAGSAGNGPPPAFKSWKESRAQKGNESADALQDPSFFSLFQYDAYYWEALGRQTFEEWLATPKPPVPRRKRPP